MEIELVGPALAASPLVHETVAGLTEGAGVVLDLGAGHGNFTSYLQRAGFSPVAVDLDPSGYKMCEAPFAQADLQLPLPFRTASVDGVVAIEVIEHIETPLPLIREVHRVLKPSGWSVITTPNVDSIASRLDLLVRGTHSAFRELHYETNGHISPVSMQQVERVASRTGLTVEVEAYNVGRLPIPKVWTKMPLRSARWRTRAFGETLVVKLRKTGEPKAYVYG